jgi:hypothetical protein
MKTSMIFISVRPCLHRGDSGTSPCDRIPLPRRKKIQHLVLLAGQVHDLSADLGLLSLDAYREVAALDRRFCVAA